MGTLWKKQTGGLVALRPDRFIYLGRISSEAA